MTASLLQLECASNFLPYQELGQHALPAVDGLRSLVALAQSLDFVESTRSTVQKFIQTGLVFLALTPTLAGCGIPDDDQLLIPTEAIPTQTPIGIVQIIPDLTPLPVPEIPLALYTDFMYASTLANVVLASSNGAAAGSAVIVADKEKDLICTAQHVIEVMKQADPLQENIDVFIRNTPIENTRQIPLDSFTQQLGEASIDRIVCHAFTSEESELVSNFYYGGETKKISLANHSPEEGELVLLIDQYGTRIYLEFLGYKDTTGLFVYARAGMEERNGFGQIVANKECTNFGDSGMALFQINQETLLPDLENPTIYGLNYGIFDALETGGCITLVMHFNDRKVE